MSKRSQRVLVSGASGFVGAAVVRNLVEQGRDVAVLVRPTSQTARIAALMPRLHVIPSVPGTEEGLRASIAAFGPDAMAHLGWQGVKGSDRNLWSQTENVQYSLDLFRISRECGVKTFVGIGSQAEYGPVTGKIDETTPTRPTTVYGASKLATCVILERAASADGKSFCWLRLFSSYGPGDDPSWLLQYVARTLLAGELPALTTAEQIWDYIHVEDVASAVVAAMDAQACGVFNLGSGTGIKLREIIESLRDLINPSLPLAFGKIPYRPDQVMHLEADISKLCAATHWRPEVPLTQGLAGLVSSLSTGGLPRDPPNVSQPAG